MTPGTGGEAALVMLLRELAHRERGRIVISGIDEAEVPAEVLRGLGLSVAGESVGLASEAQSRA